MQQHNRGGRKSLAKGSQGIWLLTPQQRYRQPEGEIRPNKNPRLQTHKYQKNACGTRTFFWLLTRYYENAHTQSCKRRLERDRAAFLRDSLVQLFSYFVEDKNRRICTLHISNCGLSDPLKTPLKRFKAISLDVKKWEGGMHPPAILCCIVTQNNHFPFLFF